MQKPMFRTNNLPFQHSNNFIENMAICCPWQHRKPKNADRNKIYLSDRPNNRLTLSTHLMIKPNLCGTTIFVSFFFFFLLFYIIVLVNNEK